MVYVLIILMIIFEDEFYLKGIFFFNDKIKEL